MSMNIFARTLLRKDLCKLLHRSTQQSAKLLITNSKNVRLLSSRTLFDSQNFRIWQANSLAIHRFYSVKAAEEELDHNDHSVTVIGEDVPQPFTDIHTSQFPDYIKKFLEAQGFTKPTIIQSHSWPIALSGQNFVGIAQTGTGKTLAYLLPAVVHLKENKARTGRGPRVLVLAPTRELARQIEQVAKDFQKLLQIKCVCVYGGASRSIQAAQLNAGVDIVIATPGRLNDFIVSKTTSLHRCTYVVLDEADRMLDMGFEPQIRQALAEVPVEKQVLMFSATWPKEVQQLAKEYLGEFVQVNVGSTELSANHNIKQHVHICEQYEKMEKFKSLMDELTEEGFGKILVFTNTKRFVDNLTVMLKRSGLPAAGIHGDKTQLQRDVIIKNFKSGRSNILVATDVAARGLDVDGITHVINYDFPNTSEDYIHRIGRTGRKDNKGVSHTFVTSEDERIVRSLINVLKEANQEIPPELEEMARNHKHSKNIDQQRYKPKPKFYSSNNRFNRYQNNSYNYNSNYNSNTRPSYNSNRNNRHRNSRYDDDEY